jgi:DNA-directed RNA polymerase subunit RPC12/RpoP
MAIDESKMTDWERMYTIRKKKINAAAEKGKLTVRAEKSKKAEFMCNRCKRNFKRDPEIYKVAQCPWCGNLIKG